MYQRMYVRKVVQYEVVSARGTVVGVYYSKRDAKRAARKWAGRIKV